MLTIAAVRAPGFVLALLVALLGPMATAHADVPVRWDCWFEAETAVDCQAVASSYFASIPYLRRGDDVSGAAPSLAVRLRGTIVPDGTNVRVDFIGPPHGPRFALEELLRRDVDRDTALVRLVGLLQRGTVPFLSLAEPGRTEGGALRLAASDPARADRPVPRPASTSGWTVRPSLWAEVVQSGIGLTSGGADVSVACSGAPLRLLATAGAAYRHLRLDMPGQNVVEGDMTSGHAGALVARTIHGGWSVAAVGGVGRAPEDNLDLSAEGAVGLEWVLSPMLPASGNGFGLRYRVGVVQHDYVTPNVLSADRMFFTDHRATATVRWHEELVDVTTSATASAPIARPDLWEVRGGVTATLRLTSAVQLEAEAEAALRGGTVREPRDEDGLDPVAALVGGSDFGRVSYVADLKLSYSFGDPLLEARDQRWRGAI